MQLEFNYTLDSDDLTASPLVAESHYNLTNNLANGNFQIDILWRNASTGSNAAWLMNGTTHEAGLLMSSPDPSWKIAANADFNYDGQDDILWRNSLTGENAIWVMKDTSCIEQGIWLNQVADTNWQIAATEDFNRDGQIDIFWRNSLSGENAVWLMNGTSVTDYQSSYPVADTNWQIAATADFNRDGSADILWRNSLTGENAIWEMNGANIINGIWLDKVADINWQIAATADFNSDGSADILWRNSLTGENAIWNMNGSRLAEGVWLTRITNTNWQIETTADFNSDGHVDILWRNQQTGQNQVWTMDKTSVTAEVFLTTIADTDWQIAGVLKRNTIEANDTLNTATNLGETSGLTTITNFVGSNDLNDYYRFSVNSGSIFRLDLLGLSNDVDVRLYDVNGTELASSVNWGAADEYIAYQLDVGTYYVKVYAYDSTNSNYTLNLSLLEANSFDSTYGYGLVNAGAAVNAALGGNFSDSDTVDTRDWWSGTGNNWGNDAVNAPRVWTRGYAGENITVAVIDDGVDINHIDLNDNIWRNPGEIVGNGIDDDGNGYIDDINGWNTAFDNNYVLPSDTHGTHVAGTIAGEANGFGVTGVAYNSNIMTIRVADAEDNYTGDIAQAIIYAVDNGARVINMSLGGYGSASSYESIRNALAYAASHNVIAVSAAGNEYDDDPLIAYQPGYPARFATDYGISVGAINESGNITYFSNGAGFDSNMLHVVAPGENIYSTIPSNSYASYPGTSMAAPHVAGVVALMLDANPHLSHGQVRQIIAQTATSAN